MCKKRDSKFKGDGWLNVGYLCCKYLWINDLYHHFSLENSQNVRGKILYTEWACA